MIEEIKMKPYNCMGTAFLLALGAGFILDLPRAMMMTLVIVSIIMFIIQQLKDAEPPERY